MRKIIKFAIREYRASVRTKGFIIGLVIAPLAMSASTIAYFLLKDRVDTTDKRVAVVDHTGLVAPALVKTAEYRNTREIIDEKTDKKIKPAYYFEIIPPNDRDPKALQLELSERVRRNEFYAFMNIGRDVVHPSPDNEMSRITYHARNAAMDDLRRWTAWPINNQLRQLRLMDAGIDTSRVRDLFYWVDVAGLGLVSVDESSGNIADARKASPVEALIIPIATMMLMFLMIMMSVPGMLHSVMEEKTQRIAEVLLGSIRPFEFMAGKLIGGVAVALTSASVYIIGGIIVVKTLGFENYFPFHVLPWFFIYVLLAVIMFGAMTTAMGSTCSEIKDAQSLLFPSLLPAVFPMFIYFPVAKEPMSSFATWMSLIPPFTPTLMVLRLGTPETIPAWQPYVGLIGIVLCTLFFVWVSGRIFRVAILMQGTPPRLGNIVKWAFRG